MKYYLMVSVVLLFFVGLIWSKKWDVNIVIKMILLGSSVWGLILLLMQLGFIIKAN